MRLDELQFQLAQEKGTTVSLDSKVDLNVKRKRRAKFAEGIAADAFGGRYFGWREWREFDDLKPDDIDQRRYEAFWSR